jgi:hypothetical protein
MRFSHWLRVLQDRPPTRRGPSPARPRVERLEQRLVPDAGDTLAVALQTGLGPAAGSYTMPSEYLGDGRFRALDVDLYRLDARAGQMLKATTSAPAGNGNNTADTILWLFDSAGNGLAVNDNPSDGTSLFSRIDYQFAADATYYVGVSGAGNWYYNPNLAGGGSAGSTGYYRLDLSLSTPVADAAGDTIAAALDTGFGPGSPPYSTAAQIGDGLYPGKDVDFYKFTAQANQLLTVSTSQPPGGQAMSTYLRLFNAAGQQLAASYNYYSYGAISNYQLVAGGTYYLGVSGYPNYYYDPNVGGSGYSYYGGFSTGDYQLDMSLQTLTPDAAGDTLASAQDTGLNQAPGTFTATAKIGDGLYQSRDVDLYTVQVAAGQAVSVTTSQPPGGQSMLTYLRLFDAAGHELTSGGFTYTSATIPGYVFSTAGTYYIGVSGYYNSSYDPNVGGSGYYAYSTGDYSISVSLFTPSADAPGDTLGAALATGLGPGLGSYSVSNATIGDGLYLAKDVDLYSFQAQAGQGLTAVTSAPAAGVAVAPILRLFDASGNQLALDARSNGSFNAFNYLIPADGTYYLGVSGASNSSYNPNVGGSGSYYPYYTGATGGYNLSLSLVTPVLDAAGDTIATAAATGLGGADGTYTVPSARVGDGFFGGKDVDLYRIDVTAGQVLYARTSQPAGGAPMSTYLRLFTAAGVQLALSGPYYYPPYGPYANITEFKFTSSGTYYIGVSGAYNYGYNPNVPGSGSIASTGDYRLDLTLVTPTPDAVGDTLATALDTAAGPADGTYPLPAAKIGDGLYLSKDVDLYKFTAKAGQTVTAATAMPAGGQSMATLLRLFNSAGQTLGYAYPYSYPGYSSYATLRNVVLPADGTYYIGVSGAYNGGYDPNVGGSGYSYGGFSTGDYALTLTLTTPPPDVGDILSTAQAIALGPAAGTGSVAAGKIGDGIYGSRDVDLYSFQATPGQLLTVSVGLPAGGQTMYGNLRVFDADGTPLNYPSYSNWSNYYGTDTPVQRLRLTKGGTYYIGVSGAGNSWYDPKVAGSGYSAWSTGDYSLNLTLVDPPPPDAVGDTLATALATGLGTGSSAYAMSAAKIGDGTWMELDVDLYQLTAAAGQKLTALTSLPAGSTSPMYTVLRLFDADGNQLQISYSNLSGGYSQLDYVFPAAGTYYVGVSGSSNGSYDPKVAGSGQYGWSTGDYRLDLTFSVPVADKVGDTIATALPTGLGRNGKKTFNLSQATIGDGVYGSRDQDLFQIQATAGQTFSAAVDLPKGSTLGGATIRLFDAAGNELANSYGYNQMEWWFDTTGTYYVGITGGYNTYYDPNVAGSGSAGPVGDYTLSLGLVDPKTVREHPVRPSVRGHASVDLPAGTGAGQLNQISVNAWLDDDGNAHGTVVWTFSRGGPAGAGGAAGYPWVLKVDTLVIYGNYAYLEAVVVRSPQSPGDVGTRVGFWVSDGGNGAGSTDYFALQPGYPWSWPNYLPIKGNFTVRS